MKKLTYLFIGSALVLASCKKKGNDDPAPTPVPETPTALVKFVNGALNSGVLSVKINDTTLQPLTGGVNFLGVSSYTRTSVGGSTKISYIYPNTGTVFQEMTSGLSAGNYYTAFVAGEVPGNIAMMVTSDDVTAPSAGKSKIRLVNLSADNYNLSFYVGGPKLDSNVAYKGVTPFYEVNAGSANIIAQDPMQVGNQRTLNGQMLEAGKIYTIIFTGKTNSTGDADLKLTVVNNN
ncbi:MAG: DUF4397 domain-containing protein [Flavipsychrobacter sp.]|nr:DUF4397 domain-containing protein [Flavipsychrobacter sp.]